MATKSKNSTRLDQAKSDLLNFIKSQESNTQFYLETTPLTGTPKELINAADLENLLRSIQVISIPDNYSKLGELEYSFTDSLVYSDKKIQGSSLSQKAIYHSPESNLALSSIQIQGNSNKKNLLVNYFFSGSGSNSFDLTVRNISNNGVEFQGKIEVLSPGRASLSVELHGDLQKNSFYKASLSNSLQIDSLDSDNEIFFSPIEEKSQEIFLISKENRSESEFLSIKPILSAPSRIISEYEFANLKLEEKQKSPLHIYYKSAMPEQVTAPSLVILPISSSKLLEIKGILKSPKISSWSETSQITRYISFESLNTLSALTFKESSWGNPIIRANGSVSMIEGQIDNYPVVTSGIELLPFEGKKSPSASILFLNILKKLENTKEIDLIEPLALEIGKTATDLTTKASYTAPSILPTGIYQIMESGKKSIEISNAYNLSESDTRTLSEEIVSFKKGISRPKILENELLFNLSLLSILVLLVDLLLILILGREV